MVTAEFQIRGISGNSQVIVGDELSNFRRYIHQNQIIIITDENVHGFYGSCFENIPVIILKPGEKSKTLKTIGSLYSQLLKLNADRSTFILGVGGGIVCDIAGYAASTYLRGLPFGFISTSLLSQADASVGGKNGVNFKGYKNLVGTFNQPGFVICDPNTLKTLPKEEISNGFAEIIKHTLIADAGMFNYLEDQAEKALELDNEVITKLVAHSISVKADIVNRDEREKGERKLLNFGHTLGHAIEKISGISHGKAVSTGMEMASEISREMGLISGETVNRIKNLLEKFNLPVHSDIDPAKLLQVVVKDKKRTGGKIAFILLKNIGEAVIEDIEFEKLKRLLIQISR